MRDKKIREAMSRENIWYHTGDHPDQIPLLQSHIARLESSNEILIEAAHEACDHSKSLYAEIKTLEAISSTLRVENMGLKETNAALKYELTDTEERSYQYSVKCLDLEVELMHLKQLKPGERQ